MKATIVAIAIGLCRPSMPVKQRMIYAKILEKSTIDPLIVVALIDHESGWFEGAISKDHKDYGLGQIRKRFLPKSEQGKLLDGVFNLTKTLFLIDWWRHTCQLKIKAAATSTTWLEGYAGHSKPKQGKWCGAGLPVLKSTAWIINRADQLHSLVKGQP